MIDLIFAVILHNGVNFPVYLDGRDYTCFPDTGEIYTEYNDGTIRKDDGFSSCRYIGIYSSED